MKVRYSAELQQTVLSITATNGLLVDLICKFTDNNKNNNNNSNNNNNKLLRIRPFGLFQFRITSATVNQFRHLARLLEQAISHPLCLCVHRAAQHRRTREGKEPRLERNLNPRSQCPSSHDLCPTPHGH
jgi:hypothetical protein